MATTPRALQRTTEGNYIDLPLSFGTVRGTLSINAQAAMQEIRADLAGLTAGLDRRIELLSGAQGNRRGRPAKISRPGQPTTTSHKKKPAAKAKTMAAGKGEGNN